MDVYLGLGILSTAIVVLAFVIFDSWFKGRHARSANMSGLSNERDPEFTHHTDNIAQSTGLEEFCKDDVVITSRTAPIKTTQENQRPDSLLVMSVMAKPDSQFGSYDLLQAISAAGLQFGEMNIFHYYLQAKAGKITLFSLASANKPGDFDLNNMGNFTCTGLMLFMDIGQVPDPQNAFKLMLDAAEQLAEDLNGDLCASPHTPWNEKLVWQYQQKIMQYRTATRYDAKY